MRRASLDMRRLAFVRLAWAVAALSVVGCSARACDNGRTELAELARQQVCSCAKLDAVACAELAAVPVRFSAGAGVLCNDTYAAGCYSQERGIEVATLDAHEGDIASGWRGEHRPWTHASTYEIARRLRHEYLHAAGYGHGDALMDCEWER